jgi:thiamine biosynthesis lipoprotein
MTTPTMKSPAGRPLQRRAWVEQVMGLPVSIHLRGEAIDESRSSAAVQAAYATLRRLEGIFSTYRTDSEVMRLRRGELSIDECSDEVRDVLGVGELAERRTCGAFTTLLPTGAGDLAFDPTGLVKGWAVERAARELVGLAGLSYCINAGGDLMIGVGADLPLSGPGSISWRVGIEDPRNRSAIAGTVQMTHGAVATSGTAARGAHLYDPATGEHVGRSGSVTVMGPELVWADIWATALFVGGERARDAFALAAPDYLSTAL